MLYVLFDIGGTSTRIATTTDLCAIETVVKFDTPRMYADGIKAIISGIREITEGRVIEAMAGGIRGPLNHEKTGIVSESKLCDWVGRSIVDALQNEFSNTPVFLENDAAIVGLGEAHFGAGRGYDIVAYHTVSTGVGGARFVHGRLDITSVGFEPGHQILDLDRTVLGAKTSPTLQNLVSGSALEQRRGVKPYEIAQDDHVWNDLAEYLGAGLKNTIVYWSPDVIVIGGSMIVGNPRIPLSAIQEATKNALGTLMPCPVIVDASLRDEGGLFGAMALIAYKLEHK